jgi:hypothetical protein
VARNTLQWDEKPKHAKAKAYPELEHQNICQRLTAIFFSKIKHYMLIAVRNKIKQKDKK